MTLFGGLLGAILTDAPAIPILGLGLAARASIAGPRRTEFGPYEQPGGRWLLEVP